jgi:hypothetical protein
MLGHRRKRCAPSRARSIAIADVAAEVVRLQAKGGRDAFPAHPLGFKVVCVRPVKMCDSDAFRYDLWMLV